MIISIVGKSGSGKGFISKLLMNMNPKIVHLDIDKIGYQIYNNEELRKQLVLNFGESVVKDNKVDRKALGKIVFTSKEAMNTLEDLTWNYMEQDIDKFIEENKDRIIILDWLLLPKTKYFSTSKLRILVTAPFDVRIKRAMIRDNITEEEFIRRDNSALNLEEYEFDYYVNNDPNKNIEQEMRDVYETSIIHR